MTIVNNFDIKPGDRVRAEYQSQGMIDAGIPPVPIGENGWTEVYTLNELSIPMVAGYQLLSSDLTILEHTKAEPKKLSWADAFVVEDNDGDLWGNHSGTFVILGGGMNAESAEYLEDNYGPIKVIINSVGDVVGEPGDFGWPGPPAAWVDEVRTFVETPEHVLTQEELENLPIGKRVSTAGNGSFIKTEDPAYPWLQTTDGWICGGKRLASWNPTLVEEGE